VSTLLAATGVREERASEIVELTNRPCNGSYGGRLAGIPILAPHSQTGSASSPILSFNSIPARTVIWLWPSLDYAK